MLQILPKKQGAAPDKYHTARFQVKPPLPERAEDVIHKGLCHVLHDADYIPIIIRLFSPDDPVNVRIVDQDVLLGIDAGGNVIIQTDDTLLRESQTDRSGFPPRIRR